MRLNFREMKTKNILGIDFEQNAEIFESINW